MMEKHIQAMKNSTDLWPWYWCSYGEKCYAFRAVEAYPARDGDPVPEPGSRLELLEDEAGRAYWAGKNGTKMIIETEISYIESQNGGIICAFIAAAHAHLLRDELKEAGL